MKDKTNFVSALLVVSAASFARAQFIPIALPEESLASSSSDERNGYVQTIIDVSGITSIDPIGSPNNYVIFINIGPFNELTGVGWDVVLQTVAPDALLSDIGVFVNNSLNAPFSGFVFTPGFEDQVPGGPTQYTTDGNIINLYDIGIPTVTSEADGLIRLEFGALSSDHSPGEIDGLWVSGSIFIQSARPIPAPAAAGLLMLAGTGVYSRQRSRRSA